MFFVYILKCSDGSYYTGHTDNLEKRIAQHKAGALAGYTSTRLPIELVFHQEFATRDEAFVIERKIKRWTRRKKEALIKREFETLTRKSL